MNIKAASAVKMLKKSPVVRAIDTICKSNVKGLHIERVTSTLLRGADIPFEMIPELPKFGIERVVNLRTISDKKVQKLTAEYAKYGIEFYNLPVNMFNFKKSIVAISDLIKTFAKDGKKTYVHCTYGKHRTGGFVAKWENMINNTSIQEVIEKMYNHGFKLKHKVAFASIPKQLKATAGENLELTA